MALDREDTLKKAEKLLRQGRLEAAIAEYARVIDEQPRDWTTANTLGDLYVRAGQPDKAVAQYRRIAEHFAREGFFPKAAALFKKILKITPQDEKAQLQLADVSASQGLLADAKAHLNAVASRRRVRGDRAGAAEIVVRLGSLDPSDIGARIAAARMLEEMRDEDTAAERFKEIYTDLVEKGRLEEALPMLREAVRLNPYDRGGRAILSRVAISSGDFEEARTLLDRETAGSDPDLLIALLEIELRSGQLEDARALVKELLALDPALQQRLLDLARDVAPDAVAAFACAEGVVDGCVAAERFEEAAAVLQAFVASDPAHVPALLKLVEVCVDGGLEATMYETQAQLTDAYLAAGQATEARVIAEDLVAREPWERAHIERFRRALVMLRVPDPDTQIAERLSGQAPFTATDLFGDDTPPAVEIAPQEPAREDAAADPEAELDLSGALVGLVEPPREDPAAGATIEDVLGGLRDDAAAEGTDHADQHMTLAHTYLEMDMVEEAMTSLRTAVRWPRRRFEAASLLARLCRRIGDDGQALEWLESAAEAAAPSPESGRELLYELGAFLEEKGETARALAVFLEIQAEDVAYRDVVVRVGRLARAQAGG